MKKLLAIILSLLMVVSLLPVTALAEMMDLTSETAAEEVLEETSEETAEEVEEETAEAPEEKQESGFKKLMKNLFGGAVPNGDTPTFAQLLGMMGTNTYGDPRSLVDEYLVADNGYLVDYYDSGDGPVEAGRWTTDNELTEIEDGVYRTEVFDILEGDTSFTFYVEGGIVTQIVADGWETTYLPPDDMTFEGLLALMGENTYQPEEGNATLEAGVSVLLYDADGSGTPMPLYPTLGAEVLTGESDGFDTYTISLTDGDDFTENFVFYYDDAGDQIGYIVFDEVMYYITESITISDLFMKVYMCVPYYYEDDSDKIFASWESGFATGAEGPEDYYEVNAGATLEEADAGDYNAAYKILFDVEGGGTIYITFYFDGETPAAIRIGDDQYCYVLEGGTVPTFAELLEMMGDTAYGWSDDCLYVDDGGGELVNYYYESGTHIYAYGGGTITADTDLVGGVMYDTYTVTLDGVDFTFYVTDGSVAWIYVPEWYSDRYYEPMEIASLTFADLLAGMGNTVYTMADSTDSFAAGDGVLNFYDNGVLALELAPTGSDEAVCVDSDALAGYYTIDLADAEAGAGGSFCFAVDEDGNVLMIFDPSDGEYYPPADITFDGLLALMGTKEYIEYYYGNFYLIADGGNDCIAVKDSSDDTSIFSYAAYGPGQLVYDLCDTKGYLIPVEDADGNIRWAMFSVYDNVVAEIEVDGYYYYPLSEAYTQAQLLEMMGDITYGTPDDYLFAEDGKLKNSYSDESANYTDVYDLEPYPGSESGYTSCYVQINDGVNSYDTWFYVKDGRVIAIYAWDYWYLPFDEVTDVAELLTAMDISRYGKPDDYLFVDDGVLVNGYRGEENEFSDVSAIQLDANTYLAVGFCYGSLIPMVFHMDGESVDYIEIGILRWYHEYREVEIIDVLFAAMADTAFTDADGYYYLQRGDEAYSIDVYTGDNTWQGTATWVATVPIEPVVTGTYEGNYDIAYQVTFSAGDDTGALIFYLDGSRLVAIEDEESGDICLPPQEGLTFDDLLDMMGDTAYGWSGDYLCVDDGELVNYCNGDPYFCIYNGDTITAGTDMVDGVMYNTYTVSLTYLEGELSFIFYVTDGSVAAIFVPGWGDDGFYYEPMVADLTFDDLLDMMGDTTYAMQNADDILYVEDGELTNYYYNTSEGAYTTFCPEYSGAPVSLVGDGVYKVAFSNDPDTMLFYVNKETGFVWRIYVEDWGCDYYPECDMTYAELLEMMGDREYLDAEEEDPRYDILYVEDGDLVNDYEGEDPWYPSYNNTPVLLAGDGVYRVEFEEDWTYTMDFYVDEETDTVWRICVDDWDSDYYLESGDMTYAKLLEMMGSRNYLDAEEYPRYDILYVEDGDLVNDYEGEDPWYPSYNNTPVLLAGDGVYKVVVGGIIIDFYVDEETDTVWRICVDDWSSDYYPECDMTYAELLEMMLDDTTYAMQGADDILYVDGAGYLTNYYLTQTGYNMWQLHYNGAPVLLVGDGVYKVEVDTITVDFYVDEDADTVYRIYVENWGGNYYPESTGGSYEVTFNLNGGCWTNIISTTTINGVLQKSLPTAFRLGYKFMGWYTEDGEEVVLFKTVFTEDTTVYARWESLFSGNPIKTLIGLGGATIGVTAAAATVTIAASLVNAAVEIGTTVGMGARVIVAAVIVSAVQYIQYALSA